MREKLSKEVKKRMILTGETQGLYKKLYIKDTEPYIFKDVEDASESYFDFLDAAARLLDVSPHNIMIAGSSRSGFSLNPSNNKRRFLEDFYEESDIDLVVVSSYLFDYFSREFTNAFYKIGHLKKKEELGKKLLKGFFDFYHFNDINEEYINWMKKTSSFQRDLQKEFDIENEINYRIFKDWSAVELYYMNSLEIAKETIEKWR